MTQLSLPMDAFEQHKLRNFIKVQLAREHQNPLFSDQDSLFTSGRLSAYSLLQLIYELDQTYRVHYSHSGFDPKCLDNFDKITQHVDQFRDVPAAADNSAPQTGSVD